MQKLSYYKWKIRRVEIYYTKENFYYFFAVFLKVATN